MAETTTRQRSWLRALLRLGLRIALTAGIFGFLLSRIDARAVGSSLARIPLGALLGCFVIMLLAVATAVLRWRLLLRAYGARAQPSWSEAWRWYLVAMFYNLLPGAVGGDIVRGYATRQYFEDGAATRSVSVVFVERVFGLAGLLLLSAACGVVSPLAERQVLWYAALGLVAATLAVTGVTLGRSLARILPRRLAAIARALPSIEQPSAFAFALVMSVITHVCISVAGHIVVHGLSPEVELLTSMVIFPLGSLAAYFPLTVAGAGARDAALVLLLSRAGVARADALATSLCLLAANLVIAAVGGLVRMPVLSADVATTPPLPEPAHSSKG